MSRLKLSHHCRRSFHPLSSFASLVFPTSSPISVFPRLALSISLFVSFSVSHSPLSQVWRSTVSLPRSYRFVRIQFNIAAPPWDLGTPIFRILREFPRLESLVLDLSQLHVPESCVVPPLTVITLDLPPCLHFLVPRFGSVHRLRLLGHARANLRYYDDLLAAVNHSHPSPAPTLPDPALPRSQTVASLPNLTHLSIPLAWTRDHVEALATRLPNLQSLALRDSFDDPPDDIIPALASFVSLRCLRLGPMPCLKVGYDPPRCVPAYVCPCARLIDLLAFFWFFFPPSPFRSGVLIFPILSYFPRGC